MPRKRRAAKARTAVTPADLVVRAKWGGVLPGVPELTAEQRQQWLDMTVDTWTPQTALHYLWGRIDPIHGCGGAFVCGRRRRPGDPGQDDYFKLDRFREALGVDREEITRVTSRHPAQTTRLRQWLSDVEAVARDRANDERVSTGPYYERLAALGYRGAEGPNTCDEPASDETRLRS